MSQDACGLALATLAEHFGVKVDHMTPPRIRSYLKALEKVPPAVLTAMVERAIDTRRPRYGDLPLVADLLEDAEYARLEILRSLGKPGCAQCEDSPGFIAVTHADGVRMERCSCWRALQAKREALQVGDRLALPEGHEAA